jgi:hypothetical protein
MVDLPWTKEEIIAAVQAEMEPSPPGVTSIKPVVLLAWLTLSSGKRVSPTQEERVKQLMNRIFRALKEDRDPVAAYDVPLFDEQAKRKK